MGNLSYLLMRPLDESIACLSSHIYFLRQHQPQGARMHGRCAAFAWLAGLAVPG